MIRHLASLAELVGVGLVLFGTYSLSLYAGLILTGAGLIAVAQLPTPKDDA